MKIKLFIIFCLFISTLATSSLAKDKQEIYRGKLGVITTSKGSDIGRIKVNISSNDGKCKLIFEIFCMSPKGHSDYAVCGDIKNDNLGIEIDYNKNEVVFNNDDKLYPQCSQLVKGQVYKLK